MDSMDAAFDSCSLHGFEQKQINGQSPELRPVNSIPHSHSIGGEKLDYGEYDPELGVMMNDNDEYNALDEVGSLPTSFASKRRSSQEDFEASADQQFVSRIKQFNSMSQQDFAKMLGQQNMSSREPESWAVPSNAEQVYEKTVLQRKRDRQSHRKGRRGSLKDYEQNTDQAWINRIQAFNSMTGQQLQQTQTNVVKHMQSFDEEPLNEEEEDSEYMNIGSGKIASFPQNRSFNDSADFESIKRDKMLTDLPETFVDNAFEDNQTDRDNDRLTNLKPYGAMHIPRSKTERAASHQRKISRGHIRRTTLDMWKEKVASIGLSSVPAFPPHRTECSVSRGTQRVVSKSNGHSSRFQSLASPKSNARQKFHPEGLATIDDGPKNSGQCTSEENGVEDDGWDWGDNDTASGIASSQQHVAKDPTPQSQNPSQEAPMKSGGHKRQGTLQEWKHQALIERERQQHHSGQALKQTRPAKNFQEIDDQQWTENICKQDTLKRYRHPKKIPDNLFSPLSLTQHIEEGSEASHSRQSSQSDFGLARPKLSVKPEIANQHSMAKTGSHTQQKHTYTDSDYVHSVVEEENECDRAHSTRELLKNCLRSISSLSSKETISESQKDRLKTLVLGLNESILDASNEHFFRPDLLEKSLLVLLHEL